MNFKLIKRKDLLLLSGFTALAFVLIATGIALTQKETTVVATNTSGAVEKEISTVRPVQEVSLDIQKVTPTSIPSSTVVESSTGKAAPTATPTPGANQTPTATPTTVATITPTPEVAYPLFKVKSIKQDGSTASFPNMKVTITHEATGTSKASQDANFEFTDLLPGTYKFEVQAVDGASISHSVCFNCDEDYDHMYNASSFSVNVTESHKVIGIVIKYNN